MTTGNLEGLNGIGAGGFSSPLLADDFKTDLHELLQSAANANTDTYIDCDPAAQTCPPAQMTPVRFSPSLWDFAQEAMMYTAILSSLHSLFADYKSTERTMEEGNGDLARLSKLLRSENPLAPSEAAMVREIAAGAVRTFGVAAEEYREMAERVTEIADKYEFLSLALEAELRGAFALAFLADSHVAEKAEEARSNAEKIRSDIYLKLDFLSRTLDTFIVGETIRFTVRSSLVQISLDVEFQKDTAKAIGDAISKGDNIGERIAEVILSNDLRPARMAMKKAIEEMVRSHDKESMDEIRERVITAIRTDGSAATKMAALTTLFSDLGLTSSRTDFLLSLTLKDGMISILREIGVLEPELQGLQELARGEILRRSSPAGLISLAAEYRSLVRQLPTRTVYEGTLGLIFMSEKLLGLARTTANGDLALEAEIKRGLAAAFEIKAAALVGLGRAEEAVSARKEVASLMLAVAEDVTKASDPQRFPDASAERLRWIAADAARLRAYAYYAIDGNLETPDAENDRRIEAAEKVMEDYIRDENNPLPERLGFLSAWADSLRKAAEGFKVRGMQEKADVAYIKASEAHNFRAGLIEKQGGERGEGLGFRSHAEIGYSLTAAADFLGMVLPMVGDAEAAAKFDESRWALYSHASTAFYRARRAQLATKGGQYSPEAIHSLHLTWAYASLRKAQCYETEEIQINNAIRTIVEAIRLTGDASRQNVLVLQGQIFTLDGLLTEALGLKHADGASNVSKERAAIYIGLAVEDDLVTEEKRETLRRLFVEAGFSDVPETEAEFTSRLRSGVYDVGLGARGLEAKVAVFRQTPIRASEARGHRGLEAMKGFFGK